MKSKKEIEAWALNAARSVCSIIPEGQDIQREEPDFLITHPDGNLGIEITELLRPRSDDGFSPVAEESFHVKLVRKAEELYRQIPGTEPVEVSVRFNNGGRHDLPDMARALAEFVSSHRHLATPVSTFYKGFPSLFFSVTIASFASGRPWWSGECGGYTVNDVYEQLALRIKDKNDRLPSYRSNLPNAPIWLLIYTGVAVSRSMSIPHGIEQWKQPFGFERVLFYSCLDEAVAEIHRDN
jgi:hypothetical protein